MVEQVVVEAKALLGDKHGAGHGGHGSSRKDLHNFSMSASWLPMAALFGAFCTLAVVAVAMNGPNGWWLGEPALPACPPICDVPAFACRCPATAPQGLPLHAWLAKIANTTSQ